MGHYPVINKLVTVYCLSNVNSREDWVSAVTRTTENAPMMLNRNDKNVRFVDGEAPVISCDSPRCSQDPTDEEC